MKKQTIAKLTISDCLQKELPLYRTKAYPHEKEKGNMMIEYLKKFFSADWDDEQKHFKNEVEEQKKLISKSKIEWTRDEDGNIISPFSAKLKKKKEEDL